MSFDPTATSIMQPYGLPCALSTEKQVMAKTSRKAAPIGIEANSEGVIQLDGVATRGMLMSGGPVVECRNVTIVPTATSVVTITAAQLVNGVIIFNEGVAATDITLPSVADLNKFLNTNLVTSAPQITNAGTFNDPRTIFRVTVISNNPTRFITPNIANPPGHTSSGYWSTSQAVAPGDRSYLALAPNAAAGAVGAGCAALAGSWDVFFIQTLGTGTDPEWVIIGSNA